MFLEDCVAQLAIKNIPILCKCAYKRSQVVVRRSFPTGFPFRIFRKLRARYRGYVATVILPPARVARRLLRDSRPRRFQSDFDFESASSMSTVRFLAHVPVAWTPSERRSHVFRSSFVRRSPPLKISKSSRTVLESTDGVLSEPLMNGKRTRAPVR